MGIERRLLVHAGIQAKPERRAQGRIAGHGPIG
jgi:hypothetical protein